MAFLRCELATFGCWHTRNVQVQVSVVIQIGKQRGACPGGDLERRLNDWLKLTAAEIMEKQIRLGALRVEGTDIQVDPSIAIRVAPPCGMSADTSHARQQRRLRTRVSKDKRRPVAFRRWLGHCY